jgi:IclR family acetate operon transcriptional repressor
MSHNMGQIDSMSPKQASGETKSLARADAILDCLTPAQPELGDIESPMRVRVIVNVGERMPLHAGSAGKAILAFGPPDLVQQVIALPLERMTGNTITNRKKLLEELDSIRKCGYAVSHGERFADALGLGAPIFDASGRVVAALNVAGPIMRFTDAEVEKFAPQVMALANQVSWALGYSGTSRPK